MAKFTFEELRGILYEMVFDNEGHPAALSFVMSKHYLNLAQQHLANQITSQDEHNLLTEETVTIQNSASNLYVTMDLSNRVQRIVEAYNSELAAADDDPTLKIVDVTTAKHEHGVYGSSGLKSKPPIFLFNQGVGFVQPAHETKVKIFYIRGVKKMILSSDLSDLPEEYEPQLLSFAALLALNAENSDASQAQATFVQMAQAGGASISGRTDTPE